ncbi:MAG: PilT/PilU family type 4a pilus ATPase [Planctomycetes bacterium]|nr:PilT/PilU family type 4a pilus ATPase [Planctomycetota bacterium]
MSTDPLVDMASDTKKEPYANRFFKAAIKTEASDIHLKVGQTARLRLSGELKSTTGEAFTDEKMKVIVSEILSPLQREQLDEQGTLDFSYEYDEEQRFRVNVFKQKGHVSLVARRVSATVPSFESLHLPPVVEKIAEAKEGLVLVVGPTGSGKTTTIASMLDHIARTRACHIVTIEDPIEYIYKDSKAIVSQREIGLDVADFDEALTYLMRQDPDVVLVGEMRDAKTVTAGLRAAETGHMVFGTLHSSSAAQAIHRILDLFPQEERDLARQALAVSVKAIISQTLIPTLLEGVSRVPAVEILLSNPTVKKLISEGREVDLTGVIRSCQREGMQDLTGNLCRLIMDGVIDPKEAFKQAPNPEELKMAMKGIKTSSEGLI